MKLNYQMLWIKLLLPSFPPSHPPSLPPSLLLPPITPPSTPPPPPPFSLPLLLLPFNHSSIFHHPPPSSWYLSLFLPFACQIPGGRHVLLFHSLPSLLPVVNNHTIVTCPAAETSNNQTKPFVNSTTVWYYIHTMCMYTPTADTGTQQVKQDKQEYNQNELIELPILTWLQSPTKQI